MWVCTLQRKHLPSCFSRRLSSRQSSVNHFFIYRKINWCSIFVFSSYELMLHSHLFRFLSSIIHVYIWCFFKKSIVQLGPIFPFPNCFNFKRICHKMGGDSLHTIFPNKSDFNTMLFPIKQGTNPTLETTPNRSFSFHLNTCQQNILNQLVRGWRIHCRVKEPPSPTVIQNMTCYKWHEHKIFFHIYTIYV